MRGRIAKSTCSVKARDLARAGFWCEPEGTGGFRRAIARGGSPPRCAAWHRAKFARARCGYGAAALPRVGMTRRRALRGPGAPAGGRGRTETPPEKLSACDTCHCARAGGIAHAGGARPYRTSRVHGALLGRRDEDIAPYRHYAREIRTAITHAKFARVITPAWCGAITHAKFARVITPAWCGAITHAKFARPLRMRGAPPVPYETIHTFRYHTMEFASVNHYLQLFLDYFTFYGDKTKKIGLQTTENKGYYRNNVHSLREATDRFSAHFEPFLPSSRSLFLPCWVY